MTFNCACAQMILYGLRTNTIRAVDYIFRTKNSVQYLWIRRDLQCSYQCTIRWTMQGLTETLFNINSCYNFTEVKSREVCTV